MPQNTNHVNAWPEIEAWMRVRNRTQSELAALLHVSGSAVTHIKKGAILLRSEQIRELINYLGIDDGGINAIYSSIFHARLISGGFGGEAPCRFKIERDKVSAASRALHSRSLPCIGQTDMAWYETALEEIGDFVRRKSKSSSIIDGEGDFLIKIDEKRADFGLPTPCLLAINTSRKVRNGDMILAKLHDGKIVYGRLECTEERIVLTPAGRQHAPMVWRCGIDVNFFFWAYCVAQVIISMRIAGKTEEISEQI